MKNYKIEHQEILISKHISQLVNLEPVNLEPANLEPLRGAL